MVAVGRTHQSAGSERVYDDLRGRILRLDLAPGEDLDEGVVSESYGLSRTPVREALIKLRAEGLAVTGRGRGARVAPLEMRDLRAFFEGLDILQRSVTRLAAIRRDDADLARIGHHMQAFEEGAARFDSETVNEMNYGFHSMIGDAAHSRYLAAAYQRCLVEGLRIGHVCFSEHAALDARLAPHLETTMRDHRDIFEAIRNKDPDRAEAIAGRHVELFRDRVSSTLLTMDVTRPISTASGLD